jgi:pyruvate/2-oxoacid:ferredoxin oxidoreductase beta subunit
MSNNQAERIIVLEGRKSEIVLDLENIMFIVSNDCAEINNIIIFYKQCNIPNDNMKFEAKHHSLESLIKAWKIYSGNRIYRVYEHTFDISVNKILDFESVLFIKKILDEDKFSVVFKSFNEENKILQITNEHYEDFVDSWKSYQKDNNSL